MEPVTEVTDAGVRLVHGRVGREEDRRPARTSLAVVVEARRRLDTCGVGRRSTAFERGCLPPRRGERVVVDAGPPFGCFLLSRDLSLSRCVLLCLEPDERQLYFEL